MLIATLKRRLVDEVRGTVESYEQLEFDAPEIEDRLRHGGFGEMGCDLTMVVCVDVASEAKP